MTDNKNTSENQPNESIKPENEKKQLVDAPRSVTTQPKIKAKPSIKTDQVAVKAKVSKIAIIALFLVIIAITGVVSSYIKTQQQFEQLKSELTHQNQQQLKNQQTEILQQISAQQQTADQRLNLKMNTLKQKNNEEIAQVNKVLERFSQSQPSDWLIHEAEYLIRIAARSVWLNNETNTAISLLSEADNRFAQLNDPQYLPIRQLIRDDITTLTALPSLTIEDTVLSLLSLNKHIDQLPLAFVHKEAVEIVKAEPTADVSDWQANLKITWDNFVDDYFTLRPINANIQPLLNPEQQQNLRHNLSLKVQLAIWAATEQKPALFQQTLADVALWLGKYFDMSQTMNINFSNEITHLSSALISFDYAIELSSLAAVRKLLEQKPLQEIALPLSPDEQSEQIPEGRSSDQTKPSGDDKPNTTTTKESA